MGQQRLMELSTRYIRFADNEARGRSPSYETLARSVAGDQDALNFLMTLPEEKRQPNLLFAAVRHLFGISPDWPHFRHHLLDNVEAVRSVMLTHSTQTNEPARCATLLPVLTKLPQPLALLEVGASAGLCLLPDLYGYKYGDKLLHPEASEARHPVFTCYASTTTPVPEVMPQIAWRAGLDLNPLDARDPSQAAWLETLVWPEQTERLQNLRIALGVAARYQPRIVQGNLTGDGLAQLCHEAPKDATLVVFHTAVLAYIADRAERQSFADRAMSLCDYWISNESPWVFPKVANGVKPTHEPGRFLLSVSGAPVAWTDPHGSALEWIADKESFA